MLSGMIGCHTFCGAQLLQKQGQENGALQSMEAQHTVFCLCAHKLGTNH